jgi:hypothetical protein
LVAVISLPLLPLLLLLLLPLLRLGPAAAANVLQHPHYALVYLHVNRATKQGLKPS